MKATIETIALIRAADAAVTTANKSGVKAVVALIQENVGEKFPHGAAVELAGILRDGQVSPHTAKRYADLTAMAVKAIAHQASLATSKAKPAAKMAAKMASIEASIAMLAGMASMAKVREWSKENGPKGDKVNKADKAEDAGIIIQGAPVAGDAAQEKAVALEGYRAALAAALKAGISPDTLKALILAAGKTTQAATPAA